MKSTIARALSTAVSEIPEIAELADDLDIERTVERTRDAAHGDFATNLAMRLAKSAGTAPRKLAHAIVEHLPDSEAVAGVEIAGPGFINFRLADSEYHREIGRILDEAGDYGRRAPRKKPRILLEFVSANPTGPLHVGHGRHAAYGATIGNLLEAAGYPVSREYYVNDAGRQMDILGVSVWLRWLDAQGVSIPFPAAGYRGEYIRDIAAAIDTSGIDAADADAVTAGLATAGDSDDAEIDALIARAKELLGEDGFDRIRQQALESILADIEQDLGEFGVTFDRWFSEQSLAADGRIDDALAVLRERGMLYEKDGATWFRATDFGDEKDRVVVRENGAKTYFASDIAYHYDKRQRGFDRLIDVLGADHHGYVTRVRAGLAAMGYAAGDLDVPFMQFVALYRGGRKVQMSTRSGEFDTLRQLRADVGNDAARFFYVSRSNDQHLDFDLDVAKSQTADNPVYYIQYAHARVVQIFGKLAERGNTWDEQNGRASMHLLKKTEEKSLMTLLSRYPEVIELAADNLAPQHVVHYLRDLVSEFSTWYQKHKFIEDPGDLRDARLALCEATRIVIANGLGLLGVSAPDSM